MMTCRDRDGGQGGFTFLEIALVLAIIVVVFVAATPLVSATLQERRLRQSMEDVEQFIRAKRLTAERDRRSIDLILQKSTLGVSADDQIKVKGQLSVRFPQRSTESAKPAGEQRWQIFSSGIVAPATVRVQEGTAWIEGDIDPLTGGVAEERYSF